MTEAMVERINSLIFSLKETIAGLKREQQISQDDYDAWHEENETDPENVGPEPEAPVNHEEKIDHYEDAINALDEALEAIEKANEA